MTILWDKKLIKLSNGSYIAWGLKRKKFFFANRNELKLNCSLIEYYEQREKCDKKVISDYRKKNAELKEVHESDKRSLALIAKKGADFEKAYNEAEELLDKQIEATYKLFEENKEAKEIIKELLFTSNELDENTRSKAEQFLKECE